MNTPKCNKCGLGEPQVQFYHQRPTECKSCCSQRSKDAYATKGVEISARRRAKYHANPEHFRAQKRAEYLRNSNKYKVRAAKWRRDHPEQTYAYEKRRYYETRKAYFVSLKIKRGGKCERCGYDKNYGALHWHHRDPKQKLFNPRQIRASKKTKAKIEAEIEKCELLCGNCHNEHHNPQLKSSLWN